MLRVGLETVVNLISSSVHSERIDEDENLDHNTQDQGLGSPGNVAGSPGSGRRVRGRMVMKVLAFFHATNVDGHYR